MTRDHVGFAIFLICLLIAPKISVDLAGLPGKSGVSLGAVGLSIWAVLSSRFILRIRRSPTTLAPRGLLIFGAYAFGISLVSLSAIAIAYSAQYFFYLILGYLLFSSYLTRAIILGQLSVTFAILASVGIVFAVGVIVSVWTGPFYPHQTLWTARQWGGEFIQQGVGFAEGTNAAGAILILFSAFFLFAYRQQSKFSWILGLVSIVALLATISRSSIVSFSLGVTMFLIIVAIRAIFRGRISKRTIHYGIAILFLLLIASGVANYFSSSSDMGAAIALGIGFVDSDVVLSDAQERLELWEAGIAAWLDGTIYTQLFGSGFRTSFGFSDDSVAWVTPHNTYIAMLADFGVVGLFLFTAPLLWFTVKTGVELLRTGGTPVEKTAFVAIVGLLAHNMTEVFFYSPVLISMVLLLLVLSGMRPANWRLRSSNDAYRLSDLWVKNETPLSHHPR